MKTIYLDIFSGISGDMFIGAMLALGVKPDALEAELGKLGLKEFRLQISQQVRGAISGTKFDVHVIHEHEHPHDGQVHSHPHSHGHEHTDHPADSHDHLAGESHGPNGGILVSGKKCRIEISVFETGVPPRFRLHFFDKQGHAMEPLSPKALSLQITRPDGRKEKFSFRAEDDFLEATTELGEPHEFSAVLSLKEGRKIEEHSVEFIEDHHHHGHEHGHGHSHSDEDHEHEHHGRTFADIRALINRSKLSAWVKEKAVAVFHRVAEAEGKIHGRPPESVHFHEVGAIDSIVDIVGACVCLERLGKPRLLAAAPVEGTGTIRCAHGTFPIPAPATLEILRARHVTLQQCSEPHELITPTGAAILAEFVESFGPMPMLKIEQVGYGLGTRENKIRPNVLRAVMGESTTSSTQHDWETDTVAVIETNLDDINAEVLGAFVERALSAGALDVFHTSIQMKKNRPGVLLTVLCLADDVDKFSELMLRETTAFGVRRTIVERRKLKREMVRVKTTFGEVAVKLGRLNGGVIQASPEFEDCRRVAESAGVPVRTVYDAAKKALKL